MIQSCPRVARYLIFAIGLVVAFETVGSFVWISHISAELQETKAAFAAQQHAMDTLKPVPDYVSEKGNAAARQRPLPSKQRQQKARGHLSCSSVSEQCGSDGPYATRTSSACA